MLQRKLNMIQVLQHIKSKSEALYYFGGFNFLIALVCFILIFSTTTKVNNISAWIKPMKFALSIGIYCWTMVWYAAYLPQFNWTWFERITIAMLGFEIIYIFVQASRGQRSHFNLSNGFYSAMYSLMAMAATAVTLYTTYIGIQFFTQKNIALPDYYLWSIRLGIIIFVIFSFEGFVMGARLSHTIGGSDGSVGIPFLNWSKTFGDPRVAHFIGMHALQVIPFLSLYLLKNTKATIVLSSLYFLLAMYTLVQALNGKPFIKNKTEITT